MSIGPGPGSVAVAILSGEPGGGDWDEVNWDQGTWADVIWNDVGCQVLEATTRWGTGQEYGVLTLADAGELDLSTYDPDRILDPLNDQSPLFGALTPGRPVRITAMLPAGQRVAGTGFIDTASYDVASATGRIRAVDGIAMLAQAQIPEDVTLPDTLRARVRAVVAAAGLGELVTVEADRPELGVDPPVASRPIPAPAGNAWGIITDAATDALVYVWVDPSSVVRFAEFGAFPAAPFAIGCPPGGTRATETTTPIGIAAATDDSCLESRGTSQAAAADGTGGQFVDRAGQGSLYAGQTTSAGTFYAYQSFVRFDTTSIPTDATITSVLLETSQNDDSSVTDFTYEARAFSWTPPIVTANWQSRAQLNALPLRATFPTASLPAPGTLFAWTSDPSFAAGINRGGWTGLVICSSRARAGTAPTGNEYAGLRAFELGLGDDATLPMPRAALAAKLTVTWVPAGPVSTWLQGLSTLASTFAGDGIRNSVRGRSGDVWTDPIVDAPSQALYGPRPFDVPRLPPDLANWAARILADRANAAYTIALGELRPLDLNELALIIQLGLQGASSVRVRDDAHGPLIDYQADIVGAHLTVSSVGWNVHYQTMLSAAAVQED